MTAALALASGHALVDRGEPLPGLLSDDRYVLPAALSFERWQQIGVTLQQMHRSINWWIGDWLAYGEDWFGEDAYQAVQEATGRGDESLHQTVWIAKSFPPHLRIEGVSWSHHRAVADLDPVERTELLTTAAREKWSTRVLRDEVDRRERSAIPADPAESPVCAADAPWTPQLKDLEPGPRRDLEYAADHAEDREQFIAGCLWAWRYASNESLFRSDRWQD